MKQLFCFGYGYTCDHLGHFLQQLGGWNVGGTTRDPEKKAELRARGIRGHVFDYTHPLSDPLFILNDVTHLLVSTPPGDEGDPAFMIHAEDIIQIPTLEWVGYLSTTGVYGDRQGAVVDETSELRPSSRRGSRRVRAEEQWLSLMRAYNLPVHIFRLSGIYGPGRSALDSVRAGVARRIDKPGHAFGRIHVEDIAQILYASMMHPNPGAIYNVSDDFPAPSHEVIAYACELLGIQPPPLIAYDEADLAPIARSFYSDNKRVSNRRIKDELGVTLRYPDYMHGLTACLEAEQFALAELQKVENTG
ncbi:MAG: SDR family oxidoreductase [Alphaproteobacteria bacterium]|nr:SDR family oxidoreductase [Alphaproteobacteria bacterium]